LKPENTPWSVTQFPASYLLASFIPARSSVCFALPACSAEHLIHVLHFLTLADRVGGDSDSTGMATNLHAHQGILIYAAAAAAAI